MQSLREHGALHRHPESIQDEAFRTGEFFDPHDGVQVKYEMLRRRRLEGRPVSEVSASFGVSRQAFYLAESAFEQGGLPALLPRRRGPKRAHKCTEEILDFVQEWRETAPEGQMLSEAIERRFGVKVHPRSIHRALARRQKKPSQEEKDTLILDEDGLYDPAYFNDRLLLGMKGTMSEAELHILRARLVGGQLNKARRGELWIRAPIGYVHDGSGRMVLDPDEQVQAAVRLLFETFHRTGSAEQVVRHFHREGILWPRRLSHGVRKGELVWIELQHYRVLNILHNPRYTGTYVCGRTRQRKVGLDGHVHYRKLPREEWKIFIPHVHPEYLPWQQYESNQRKLLENANGYGPDRKKSPPREGAALLQGLALCGICGRRMTVRYTTRKGHPIPDYVCQRQGIQTARPICQRIAGTGLDEAVAEVVLQAVTPAALEVALEVFEELRARKAELDRLHRAQIERARQDAELAQHQYLLVRPENRLVADALERQWNDKLAELARLEEEYTNHQKGQGCELNPEAREEIRALVSDLPRVWHDPRTSARDRKRMLRLLIEDVTLVREQSTIRIAIRWKGGATTELERPRPLAAPELYRTPPDIVEQVRSLATLQTDAEIARTLNARWLRSGRGNKFTRLTVKAIRRQYGIDSLRDSLRKQGWLTPAEAAARLGIHYQTAKRFAIEGVLEGCRVNDKDEILLAPLTGPLPQARPGKRLKDRRRFARCVSKRNNEV
ncbi:recombinase family protein [Acidobacteria bacterium AH-259-L09]|nr:recombinase family protein [Acidobacteria bacterium AH-259-L09]